MARRQQHRRQPTAEVVAAQRRHRRQRREVPRRLRPSGPGRRRPAAAKRPTVRDAFLGSWQLVQSDALSAASAAAMRSQLSQFYSPRRNSHKTAAPALERLHREAHLAVPAVDAVQPISAVAALVRHAFQRGEKRHLRPRPAGVNAIAGRNFACLPASGRRRVIPSRPRQRRTRGGRRCRSRSSATPSRPRPRRAASSGVASHWRLRVRSAAALDVRPWRTRSEQRADDRQRRPAARSGSMRSPRRGPAAPAARAAGLGGVGFHRMQHISAAPARASAVAAISVPWPDVRRRGSFQDAHATRSEHAMADASMFSARAARRPTSRCCRSTIRTRAPTSCRARRSPTFDEQLAALEKRTRPRRARHPLDQAGQLHRRRRPAGVRRRPRSPRRGGRRRLAAGPAAVRAAVEDAVRHRRGDRRRLRRRRRRAGRLVRSPADGRQRRRRASAFPK